jgi:hypothetical protein
VKTTSLTLERRITLRLAGLVSITCTLVNAVADLLLFGGGMPVSGAEITLEAMRSVPYQSVFTGSILGVIVIPSEGDIDISSLQERLYVVEQFPNYKRVLAVQSNGLLHSVLTIWLMLSVLGQGSLLQGSVALFSSSQPRTVTPGAHCPLMHPSASHYKSSPPHCPMHQTAMQSRYELRCACSHHLPASSPEIASFRFVLPHAAMPPAPEASGLQCQEPSFFVTEPFFSPPHPPPRLFSFIPAIPA